MPADDLEPALAEPEELGARGPHAGPGAWFGPPPRALPNTASIPRCVREPLLEQRRKWIDALRAGRAAQAARPGQAQHQRVPLRAKPAGAGGVARRSGRHAEALSRP